MNTSHNGCEDPGENFGCDIKSKAQNMELVNSSTYWKSENFPRQSEHKNLEVSIL